MKKRILLSLFRLWSVALYEAKLVARSTSFKVLFVFLFFISIFFLFRALRNHEARAIVATVPYQYFIFILVILGVFTLLAAIETLECEIKTDTLRMLHVRPISTGSTFPEKPSESRWSSGMGCCLACIHCCIRPRSAPGVCRFGQQRRVGCGCASVHKYPLNTRAILDSTHVRQRVDEFGNLVDS